jgi:acyl-CoA reductase-like NAD-dependent aldehyde dehydrogenase
MNPFQDLFDAQKAYFSSNITRTYEWRMEQLDRMGRMVAENEADLQKAMARDFKTASQEYVFETLAELGEVEFQKSQLKAWMEPVEGPVPRFLAKTGHKGMVYREPYGVTLIIGPFNGPLTLLVRPALTALGAGNTCILKLAESVSETSALLLKLVPKYFDPRAVAAVAGHREEVGELLKCPFDFIFFTGSTKVGRIVARAAAENLTPVMLELGGQNPALVDETANISDAAKKIAWGAMAWGGQWLHLARICLCPRVRGRRFRGRSQESAHHLCVGVGGPLERHRLDHGFDAAEDTEFERRVPSRRRAGESSFHAPAAELQVDRGEFDRVFGDAERDHLATRPQPFHRVCGCFACRRRGEHDRRPAKRLERLGRIGCGAVDVVMRAELPRQVVLIGSTPDRRDLKSHMTRVLHG